MNVSHVLVISFKKCVHTESIVQWNILLKLKF